MGWNSVNQKSKTEWSIWKGYRKRSFTIWNSPQLARWNSFGTLKGKNPEYDAILPYAGKETIQRILEIAKNQTDDTLFASVHTPGSRFLLAKVK